MYTKTNGTPIVKATLKGTSIVPDVVAPVTYVATEDIWEDYIPQSSHINPVDPNRRLKWHTGDKITKVDYDLLYATVPTVTAVVPAVGPIAGGTVVTLTGTSLLDATGVTVGGTAATGFTKISSTALKFTTPVTTAGAKDVVTLHPAGNVTNAGAFTSS